AARLAVHLVAEFIDEQPDHVQTNRFIVELRLAAGAARMLLYGARRHAPDLDLQPSRLALENQLQLTVATSPLLGGGGASIFTGLANGDVQVVDFLEREPDDEAERCGGPLGDDDVVADGRELELRDVGAYGGHLVAGGCGLAASSAFRHDSS